MRFIAILIVLCSVDANAYQKHLALYDTAKYTEDFSHFDYVNPEAPKGGVMSLDHQLSSFDSFNIFIISGNAMSSAVSQTFDSLMKASLDENGVFYPLIAREVELSKKRDYIKFKINPQAKFHDNSAIEAKDVVFTVHLLKSEGNPSYKEALRDIETCSVIQNLEVGCVISNTNNPSSIASLVTLPILSKANIKSIGFADNTKIPILGSGAYAIGKYEFNSFLILERVQNYWASDLPVNKGQYNFDSIKYDIYTDLNMAIEALKTGLIDYRDEFSSKAWAKYDNWKLVKEHDLVKETQFNGNSANLQFYALNMRRDIFKDIALRRAINIAFDFDWMNQKLFYGSYKRLFSHYTNTDFAATSVVTDEEKTALKKIAPKEFEEILKEKLPHYSTNADSKRNRANLEEALQMLKNNGYEIDQDSLISPVTKQPVEIELVYNTQAFERILIAYQKNLKKLGIKLKLRLLDQAQYAKRIEEFQYDMVGGVVPGYPIPGVLERQLWHSSSNVKAGFNLSGVNDPVVDKIIEEIETVPTLKEKKVLAKLLDRVLLVKAYTVLQYYSDEFRIIYWDKFERPNIKPLYAVGTETWWIKPKH